jgi:hypothetical protein
MTDFTVYLPGREGDGYCSCGGRVVADKSTEPEIDRAGCRCCTMAMKCNACGTRWVFHLEAPEME